MKKQNREGSSGLRRSLFSKWGPISISFCLGLGSEGFLGKGVMGWAGSGQLGEGLGKFGYCIWAS